MTLTRDQLRAARILLHLRQDELAALAKVGVATIRRFEGGQDVGELYLDAMRRAVEQAGAILINDLPIDGAKADVGVAILRAEELPEETRSRLRGAAEKMALAATPDAKAPARRGRPPKA